MVHIYSRVYSPTNALQTIPIPRKKDKKRKTLGWLDILSILFLQDQQKHQAERKANIFTMYTHENKSN